MHLNLSYVLCVIVSISYLSSVHFECTSFEPNNDFVGSPLNTIYKPIAININTKNVKPVFTPIPLKLTGTVTAKTLLYNTGISVQTTNQRHNDGNVTRGVVQADYTYLHFTYYWTNSNSTKITGTTFNGKGFPYEVRVLWRNSKYNTISKAVKHEDGFVELVLLYDFCSTYLIPNTAVQKVFDQIKKIQKAGSFTSTFLATQIKAANFIPINARYYSYLGSFLNTETGQKHKCSTVIIIQRNPLYCITKKQFDETFNSLENDFGKPFTNTMTHDSAEVKVLEAKGVTQSFLI